MDRISKEHRSWNMSRIKGKDTMPELKLRAILHRLGYRFKLNVNALPGKPDIVLPKYNAIIFVNGCFWHRHKDCKYAYTPKSRNSFWNEKFKQTIKRDHRNTNALKQDGWDVTVFWECEIRDEKSLEEKLRNIFERAQSTLVTN